MTKENEVKEDSVKVNSTNSPFISDDDVFDIRVEYYKENKRIFVKGVSDLFDDKKNNSIISFKVKYPSQADCEMISASSRGEGNLVQEGEVDVRNFFKMELARFLTLVRSWNEVSRELNNKNVMDLHPDIIRAALLKVRDELGTTGII